MMIPPRLDINSLLLMVLLLSNGVLISQNHGVMLPYGNNNLQSMSLSLILNFGIKVMVLMVMTWVVSTKTEKLMLMTKEFMLLTMTTVTKLV